MAQTPAGDRTEAPTPKRLADAAKRGDLLQSRELTTALSVAAGIAWLIFAGPLLVHALADQLRAGLSIERGELTDFEPQSQIIALLMPLAVPMALLAAAMILAGVAAPAVLRALGWRSDAAAFKPDRINPLAGLKRMFGAQGLVELARSLAKVALLGVIACVWLVRSQSGIAALGNQPGLPLAAMGALIVSLMTWLLAGLVIIAAIDVPVQALRRLGRLRMSKQEIRDEHKEAEGAPEKKAAIRARQVAILSRSMRAGVASASVVVTNPEHFAVALRYTIGVDAAPVIVARGHDALAAAIRDHARAHAVPVLSLPPLARAIYFTGQIGQMVDTRLYLAVATLLAFIFRLDRQAAEAAMLPMIVVPGDVRFDADGRREMA